MHLPVRKAGVTTRKSRGQSLVELALVAPVVLLLVLIALDFGRVFLGWVSLNNAARVGANFAALHPGAWPGDADAEASYIDLIEDNADAINCELNPSTPQPPSFGGSREIGQPVTVNLRCDFELLTPIVGSIVGPTIAVRSESTFPISKGCLDDCPSGPGPTAPPPPENNCRDIPDMVGMSVAGARLAWIAEGFSGATFDPATGDDTRTVESQVVTEPTNDENCPTGEAIFTASVVVALEDLVTPPPTPTCLYVPNMIGMAVADARDAWTDTGFLGEFLPTDEDERIVLSQVTDPASDPGDCLEPDTTVSVTHGAPYPDPPPAPCLVPSLVNTSSDSAVATWTDAGFDEDNLEFDRPNQLPYTIVSQTLVGGTYQSCTSSMEVSDKP